MKKILPMGIAVLLCLNACNNTGNKNNIQLQGSPGFIASLDSANYTTIAWPDSTQSFGTIQEGDSVKLTFTFKNTGSTPLFLSGVRTACGCTVVNLPKQAVLPAHVEKLTVTFNSKYHPGYMRRSIVVTSNTKNGASHTLIMEGTVIKQVKK